MRLGRIGFATSVRPRATESGMFWIIASSVARSRTDVANPIRPTLNEGVLKQGVRTGQQLAAQKKEVQTAEAEIKSMVSLGQTMLGMARDLVRGQGEEGFDVSLAWVRSESAQLSHLTGLAAEDDGARAKDLSAAMAARMAAEAEGQGQMGKPGMPGPDSGKQGGIGSTAYPAISGGTFRAVPGRKILSDASGADWMFVDSWYVIGPFPNPQRVNIDKKFPPETVVDLDAQYVGKDDHIVRWRFIQSPTEKVRPEPQEEYAIYYAYTELWADEACDLWLAVGSDDNSRLWIENQPVWVSGRGLKPWRIDEGYRKVHFRQGLNRILLRLENGWGACEFSLVICTRPEQ